MPRKKKSIATTKLTVVLTLADEQALRSAAATLEREPNWVLGKLARLAAGEVELSKEIRRWLRGDTAFDTGVPGDQQVLMTIGNPDPPVVRVPRRKTVAQDPPAPEIVKAYVRGAGYGFDPAEFHAFYSANGWVQGNGKPLIDWKAACQTWQISWLKKNPESERIIPWGANRPKELDEPQPQPEAPVDDETEELPLDEQPEE